MNLHLDWVGIDAAKYACEHWHYSKCVPAGKMNVLGVWEDEKYIGCVIFSYGSNPNLCKQYGLIQQKCVELTRVALCNHKNPVTKIVSIAIKMLRKKNPDLQLIVSYADPEQDHVGIIYQGGNWVFVGVSVKATKYIINGKVTHNKTVSDAGMDTSKLKRHTSPPKYKYLYPLSDDMKRQIDILRKPYPKKSVDGVMVNTTSYHEEKEGSKPISTHFKEGIQ